MKSQSIESCENCGRGIGKLETPRLFNDAVVCRSCWEELSKDLTPVVPQERHVVEAIPHREIPTIHLHASAPQPQYVQTIQATGKVWKLQILLATLACITGTVLIGVGSQEKPPGPVLAIGAACVVLGLIWFVVARIGAWWFHG